MSLLDPKRVRSIGMLSVSFFGFIFLLLFFITISFIGIALAKIKVKSSSEIARTILFAKQGVLTEEHLETLVGLIPTSEEVSTLYLFFFKIKFNLIANVIRQS